jgi:hypothetical protein
MHMRWALPFRYIHGSLATGVQYGKVDDDLYTTASLARFKYNRFVIIIPLLRLEDGGWMAPMAVELGG